MKYRILEEIDTSISDRETRKHIKHDTVIRFYLQEKREGLFYSKWITIKVCKNIESAKRSLEDIIGVHKTIKIHEVEISNG